MEAEVSDAAILRAIEAVVKAMGKRLENLGRAPFSSEGKDVGVLTEEYLDLATSCIFAIASMIPESEVGEIEPISIIDDEMKRLQDAKEAARQKMQERANKSGLIIASDLP
jgi:hypothetical protein